ncbi:hypothetical protein PM082_011967 [Marasmius tenuissimus]|nr:hypothetical protein PM082_011967 [Marasmius tenuissimus]
MLRNQNYVLVPKIGAFRVVFFLHSQLWHPVSALYKAVCSLKIWCQAAECRWQLSNLNIPGCCSSNWDDFQGFTRVFNTSLKPKSCLAYGRERGFPLSNDA